MDRQELMQMAADKAREELSDESIEFLFRPRTQLELLLRSDFKAMEAKCYEWLVDDSPSAMPYRFREPYWSQIKRAIEVERFYRAIKQIKEPLVLDFQI